MRVTLRRRHHSQVGPHGQEIYFTRVIGPFNDLGGAASAVLWAASLDGSNVHRVSPEGIEPAYEDYARKVPALG